MPEFLKCYEYWYDGTLQDSLNVEKYYNPIKNYGINSIIVGGLKGGELLGTPLPDWWFHKKWRIGLLPVAGRVDVPIRYCYVSKTTTGNPKLVVCDDNIKDNVVGALVVFRLVPGFRGTCLVLDVNGDDFPEEDTLVVADSVNSPSGKLGAGDQLICIIRDGATILRKQKQCRWLDYYFQQHVPCVNRLVWNIINKELILEKTDDSIDDYEIDDLFSDDGKSEEE